MQCFLNHLPTHVQLEIENDEDDDDEEPEFQDREAVQFRVHVLLKNGTGFNIDIKYSDEKKRHEASLFQGDEAPISIDLDTVRDLIAYYMEKHLIVRVQIDVFDWENGTEVIYTRNGQTDDLLRQFTGGMVFDYFPEDRNFPHYR